MNGGPDGRRMTVTLVAHAHEQLRELEDRTSLSSTDLVNRAITLYEFVDAQLRVGHGIFDVDLATGAIKLVQLIEASAGQALHASPARIGRGWRTIARRLNHPWRHLRPHGRSVSPLPRACLTGQEVRTA